MRHENHALLTTSIANEQMLRMMTIIASADIRKRETQNNEKRKIFKLKFTFMAANLWELSVRAGVH